MSILLLFTKVLEQSPSFCYSPQCLYLKHHWGIIVKRRIKEHKEQIYVNGQSVLDMSCLLCCSLRNINNVIVFKKAHFNICAINHFVISYFTLDSKLFSRCLTHLCFPPYAVTEARGSQGKEVHYTSGSISSCVRTIPLSMKDDSICPLSHFACPNALLVRAYLPIDLWFVGMQSQEW